MACSKFCARCNHIQLLFLILSIGAATPSVAAVVNADTLNVDPGGNNSGTSLTDAIIFSGVLKTQVPQGLVTIGGRPATPPLIVSVPNAAGIASSRGTVNPGGIDFYTLGPVPSARQAQIQVSISRTGNVGIGTTDPSAPLEISKPGYAQINLTTTGAATSHKWAMFANGAGGTDDPFYAQRGDFEIADMTLQKGRMWIDSNGRMTVQSLQIQGGGDLAEPFAVTDETVEPGEVMVIDADHPGQLRPSMRAYDKTVAGVLSGAGGIHAGVTLTQAENAGTTGNWNSHQDVALSGRVYVLADATHEPIQPGDLLTTSNVRGHCMKASDYDQARGAILGKAMSSLPAGKGMVLALVTLQ